MKYRLTALCAAFLISACSGSDAPEATAGGEASQSPVSSEVLAPVTGDGIRAHMTVLADDSLQGREAGTPGYQAAADYVAEQFRAAGLTPLGDRGTFMQAIEFAETRLVPESARFALIDGDERVDLVFRDDFIRSGGFGEAVESVRAPLVFVGHGIVAPEYGHDDYAGVDVDGRILVMLSGAPPQFDTDQRAYYSSGRTKTAEAAERGAIGIVTVRTPVDQERRPWARYLPGIGSPGMRWLDEQGDAYKGYPEMTGGAVVSESGAEKLFALAGHDLDAIFEKHASGATGSFALDIDAELARTSTQHIVPSANVVALLRGSDPALADEYIVYSAHLDHIGIRPSDDGDEIHNGAYDNAAGIGIIIEIAKALAAMETRPRRSIVFAAVTAEEKGLQGSSYFAKNPPVPASQLVANINIDMPYLGFPVADVHAFGAEHSTLHAAALAATEAAGMELTPDPLPEEVRFVRSDQFSFVQEGIPAVAFKSGSQSSDPSVDGAAMLDDFLKNHYHRASDDLDLPWSAEGAGRFARAAMAMGLIVANDDARPRWNDGDFFGDKFAR